MKMAPKIELKDNQRVFLKWVIRMNISNGPVLNNTALGNILRMGHYADGGNYQRELNKLRNGYMKEYKEFPK